MPQYATRLQNDGSLLLLRGGEDGYVIDYSAFSGRYEHIMYVPLGHWKTMCVAYAFQLKQGSVAVLWGACLMSHRKGSPPKKALRHTAVGRLRKRPAHAIMSEECFGHTLLHGKAYFRMNMFKELVREDGVKGARIARSV
tara:strand:- start:26 stop:445 length:420 start_codon:yes stop_codon:yes gene_type:complete